VAGAGVGDLVPPVHCATMSRQSILCIASGVASVVSTAGVEVGDVVDPHQLLLSHQFPLFQPALSPPLFQVSPGFDLPGLYHWPLYPFTMSCQSIFCIFWRASGPPRSMASAAAFSMTACSIESLCGSIPVYFATISCQGMGFVGAGVGSRVSSMPEYCLTMSLQSMRSISCIAHGWPPPFHPPLFVHWSQGWPPPLSFPLPAYFFTMACQPATGAGVGDPPVHWETMSLQSIA